MQKYNILVLDDHDENLNSTKELLRRWNYNVDTASQPQDAVEMIRSRFKDYAVALLDYQMPGKTGPEVALEIREFNPEIVVIIHSAYPSVESLTATIRAGALNFIGKSEDLKALKDSLEKGCQEYEKVRRVKPPLSEDEMSRLIASIGMVGKSHHLSAVATQVHKYRPSKHPVLILGETGVGKELIARALHTGHRDQFFPVNCAAFTSSSLVESELFGHEKGAFTGAIVRKVGILEAAKGGTVYLDELHHLDLQTQGKLLRVLREKKIRRVGGLKEEPVDFRLVASSWPDVERRIANGTLLPDLYYRIKYLTIEISPLKSRPEDIEPLINHYCQKHFLETGIRKQFLMRTVRRLEQYSWPGNVGELDGCVSALLTESDGEIIDERQLNPRMLGASPPLNDSTLSQLELRQERERKAFFQYILQTSRSALHASQKLGMKQSTFHSIITRLGIRGEN
ncbi:MAG: sigma-54-dependent Fis family transcriptional regulator [Bdellovibrio sp.]|nr:sigma-54-dependent Fis family transcriptional regulator [Bdellovibrio sp.]